MHGDIPRRVLVIVVVRVSRIPRGCIEGRLVPLHGGGGNGHSDAVAVRQLQCGRVRLVRLIGTADNLTDAPVPRIAVEHLGSHPFGQVTAVFDLVGVALHQRIGGAQDPAQRQIHRRCCEDFHPADVVAVLNQVISADGLEDIPQNTAHLPLRLVDRLRAVQLQRPFVDRIADGHMGIRTAHDAAGSLDAVVHVNFRLVDAKAHGHCLTESHHAADALRGGIAAADVLRFSRHTAPFPDTALFHQVRACVLVFLCGHGQSDHAADHRRAADRNPLQHHIADCRIADHAEQSGSVCQSRIVGLRVTDRTVEDFVALSVIIAAEHRMVFGIQIGVSDRIQHSAAQVDVAGLTEVLPRKRIDRAGRINPRTDLLCHPGKIPRRADQVRIQPGAVSLRAHRVNRIGRCRRSSFDHEADRFRHLVGIPVFRNEICPVFAGRKPRVPLGDRLPGQQVHGFAFVFLRDVPPQERISGVAVYIVADPVLGGCVAGCDDFNRLVLVVLGLLHADVLLRLRAVCRQRKSESAEQHRQGCEKSQPSLAFSHGLSSFGSLFIFRNFLLPDSISLYHIHKYKVNHAAGICMFAKRFSASSEIRRLHFQPGNG